MILAMKGLISYGKYFLAFLFIILIGFIVFTFFKVTDNPFSTSSNPENVLSPVENINTNFKVDNKLIYNLAFRQHYAMEKIIYNWKDIFDIFTSNPSNQTNKFSVSENVLTNLSSNVRGQKKTFFKGSSDEILSEYGDVIKEECKYYNLDWRLILAMIKQESAFTSDAVSHAGAYGFMQIMPRTGSMLENVLNLDEHRSPKNNLIAGIYYYAMLVGRFNQAGDTNKYKFALASYNAGSGHVEDAMSLSYYNSENYWDWNIVKEYMKLLAPGNDSLHRKVWNNRPPNGVFANWKEPYNYVENISWYWSEYKRIYSLPEDKPKTKKKRKK